jgi:hypothetical protein
MAVPALVKFALQAIADQLATNLEASTAVPKQTTASAVINMSANFNSAAALDVHRMRCAQLQYARIANCL